MMEEYKTDLTLFEKIMISAALIGLLCLLCVMVIETVRAFNRSTIETFGDAELLKEFKRRDILRFVINKKEKE